MAIVVSAVSSILQKLSEPLIQEAIFLYGVGDQINWIEAELRRMQCFLKDAESKQEQDKRVKNWVLDVRDIAYEAEDVIETFAYRSAIFKKGGFMRFIKRFDFILNKLIAWHKVGSEIERIKNKIRAISESRSIYGIETLGREAGTSSASRSLRDWRLTSPDFEEPDFVGFQQDLETLVARLTGGDRRRCVVSVVGMGGLGKTTLGKKIYNSGSVQRHFHLCSWFCISQEYNVRDLLQSMLSNCIKLSEEELKKVEKMDLVQLKYKISEYLRWKRYLVVLDDMWNNEAWDSLKDAFPDMSNGSRILLTTRNKGLALHADSRSLPYELRLLEEEESWKLFCKKTFPGQTSGCPMDLQKLGREIVEKCHGLPLAIVVIGGLLSTKEPREWENVLKCISWQFVKGEVRISEILSLSYNDLPNYLKPCFLYLGIFPEDHEFPVKNLIQLWTAEGFLEQRGHLTMEEVGEDYLRELVERSLLQIAERNSCGVIKSCRIHDLLRDVSTSKAKEGNFLDVHHDIVTSPSVLRPRRLAIHNAVGKNASSGFSAPHLRSVLLFTPNGEWLKREQMKFFSGGFKLLRVLDLYGVVVGQLPNEIGTLIHLRYLSCDQTYLRRFPSSIGNLCNLETLNATSECCIRIPSTIEKMQRLRHLQLKQRVFYYATSVDKGKMRSPSTNKISGCPRLDRLSNLQTLTHIQAGKWIYNSSEKLKSLRKLGIHLASVAYAKACYEFIVKLDCLQSLSISVEVQHKIPAIVPLTNHHKLQRLSLTGRLEKLPESFEFPTNLTKLTLDYSSLEQDPMATLEKLKNLQILRLRDSYVEKEMTCSSHGFPQLKFLYFHSLEHLEEWRAEEGSMPSLLHLRIDNCRQLKKLPEAMQHITTLRELEVWNMRKKFMARLQENLVEDWHKIQNIPYIDVREKAR